MIYCAPKVAQDALERILVGFLWIVDEQAELLNRITDIRPCEGEVLESPDKGSV